METIRIELHILFQDIKINFCYHFSSFYFKEENIQIDCFYLNHLEKMWTCELIAFIRNFWYSSVAFILKKKTEGIC